MPIAEQALHTIHDRASLFAFLRDHLNWPVDPEDTFTYQGPQLHGDITTRAVVSQMVPFTAGDRFTIMLVEFETPFRRTDLREILRRMREEIRKRAKYGGRKLDEIIFVCATESYRGIRFVHFEEQAGRPPRMTVFGWDREQPGGMRTLLEYNLPALQIPPRNVLGEAVDGSQARWDDAWDVEKVTRAFFREYRATFEAVEQRIEGVRGDRRLFTQRLFNRLLFIQFLARRGWLRFEGSADYLTQLFTRSACAGENVYHDRLYWVFFYGLGTQNDNRETHDLAALQALRGDVPYLNGGLFEMADADDVRGAVQIENAAFERILDLFQRWNFTISESTPLDVEVAVDPEMLGKVFEELVTGRHESGSYYTPRGIVAFMCREALKHYLEAAGIAADAAATFVDERSTAAFRERDFETALAALKRVRVVDPACGSGAYLLGMLHELVELRKLLFNPNRKDDPRDDYGRKLEIIQRNLYGVDLDEFAVNIARLRLWLSLAVEYEGATPEPLPNLDFKIERGDSLTAPDPGNTGDIDMFRHADIADCEEKKAQYANPYDKADKRLLKREIERMCDAIALWTHGQEKVPSGAFDWRVHFGEVFTPQVSASDWGGGLNLGGTFAEPDRPGGFDIVVANPPYVRQELIKEIKPVLQKTYPGVYNGTADLYTYFYARAVQLLKPGGVLAFISPNKWFRAGYGANLRKTIAEQCRIHSITDFGELPVFENAATFPMVFVAQRGKSGSGPVFTQVKSLDPPYPDVLALVKRDGNQLPSESVKGAAWTLTDSVSADRLRKMQKAGLPLDEYVKGHIYRGVVTCCNPAFFIDDLTRTRLVSEDPRSAEIIKPLIIGDDVRRWRIVNRQRWIIYTPWSLKIENYPAIGRHLVQWKQQLLARAECKEGKYNWWCLSRYASDYYQEFDMPKIVYPDIGKEPRFAFDDTGAYINDMTFMVSKYEPYLLGVLNSSSVWDYLKTTCAVLGDSDKGGRMRLKRIYVARLPIPDAPNVERQAIATLAQKCLDAKGIGCEEWEREINERVAALYGL